MEKDTIRPIVLALQQITDETLSDFIHLALAEQRTRVHKIVTKSMPDDRLGLPTLLAPITKARER